MTQRLQILYLFGSDNDNLYALFNKRKRITTFATNTVTFVAYQDGKMSTNFAKFLSVRMIVKTEIAQVLILAHAKLGGPALTALIVFVYQAATMAFVIYPLNVNATQDGLECFATSVCHFQNLKIDYKTFEDLIVFKILGLLL